MCPLRRKVPIHRNCFSTTLITCRVISAQHPTNEENEKDNAKAGGKGRDRSTPQHIDARTDTPLLVHCLLFFVRVSPWAFQRHTRGNVLTAHTHTSRCVVVFILLCTLSAHNTPPHAPTIHVADNNTAPSSLSWSLSYSECCVVVVLSFCHCPCCRVIFSCCCHGGCRHVVMLVCCCRRVVVQRQCTPQHSTHSTQAETPQHNLRLRFCTRNVR